MEIKCTKTIFKKKCIYLFWGEKKVYTVGCFPIWRKGAVLHSVNQKSGFSNLTLEEAFIDFFYGRFCVNAYVWK